METRTALIRAEDMATLRENGRKQLAVGGSPQEIDHYPVVKLVLPFSKMIWLLSELEPGDDDIAFGLCDLGIGFPELGSVYLPELIALQHGILRVTQDITFSTRKTMSWWAGEARRLDSLADVREP